MHTKDLRLILAFAVVLVFGIVIGYALKPSVEVRVCDPADLGLVPPAFDRSSPWYRKLEDDAVIAPVFGELEIANKLECWQPVAKIGLFDVYVNRRTGGYLIGEDNCRKTIVMQETASGRTDLTILGKRQEISVRLTYDAATGKRIRSIFETTEEGGLLGLTRWGYMDNDADGRFDVMVDHRAGIAYEQKGLQWIEIGRREGGPNSSNSGSTEPSDVGGEENGTGPIK